MKKLLPVLPLVVVLAACGAKEKDILVASKPEGAAVQHQGALLGRTPLTLKVKEPMELTLSKDGYAEAKLVVDAKSDGIQTVTLSAASGAGNGGRYSYPNIRATKTAYEQGKITESRYKEIKKYYEELIDLEKNRLKTQYKAGQITESQYDSRVKALKERYE